MNERDELCDIACELADAARAAALGYFGTRLDVERKADDSPVSRADREAEEAMRKVLAARVPHHGVVGEEFGAERDDAAFVWVLDPIDGTKAFITGKPLWGSLIGLLRDGVPYLGVIDLGALGQRWVGMEGVRTKLNGDACHVSTCTELAQARLGCTSPDIFTPAQLPRFDALGREIWFRSFGGDCAAYATLASGHLELVVEAGLQNYDYTALVPVVEGAGGIITDWQGRALDGRGSADVLAAANGAMHEAAMRVLNG